MNDTEEAVRRLFAAASEDIPPGVNLLRGVQVRRRERAVRVRALLATGMAGIVAAVAAITLSVSQAPSALAQVTQAASRTAAQSYRATVVVTVVTAPGSASTPPVTVSGEFEPARDVGEETTSQGFQVRFVGGYAYLSVTDAIRTVWDSTQTMPLPAGKSWLRAPAPRLSADASVEVTLLRADLLGIGQFSPQDLLALLESASQVREVGSASGPGWTGSAYTFTAPTTLGGPLRIVVSTSGTVDVDQQGRVRQLDATETLGKTVRKAEMTFRDFGVPVSVSAPPASEAVSMPG